MKMDKDVVVPLGTCARFMSPWNFSLVDMEDYIDELSEELPNSRKDFARPAVWREMSYNRYKDTSFEYEPDIEYS